MESESEGSSDDDDEEDQREMEGKTFTEAGNEVIASIFQIQFS